METLDKLQQETAELELKLAKLMGYQSYQEYIENKEPVPELIFSHAIDFIDDMNKIYGKPNVASAVCPNK